MLYPTMNQPLVVLMVFLAGIASGVCFDIAKVLTFLSGKDKYSKAIFEFLATIISLFMLFLVNLKFNYGQFRLYVLLIFALSLIIEQFFLQLLWTKLLSKCYNRHIWKKKDKRKEK